MLSAFSFTSGFILKFNVAVFPIIYTSIFLYCNVFCVTSQCVKYFFDATASMWLIQKVLPILFFLFFVAFQRTPLHTP